MSETVSFSIIYRNDRDQNCKSRSFLKIASCHDSAEQALIARTA